MPSVSQWSPASGTKSPTWSAFAKTWNNTLNYRSVAEWDLPINTYGHDQIKGSQTLWLGRITYQTGSTVTYSNLYHPYNDYFFVNNATADYVWGYLYSTTWHDFAARYYEPILNRVKLKALTKVADAKINMAVAVAEGRKTADMILDAANRIWRSYRAFRRGNFKEVARNLNIPPNRVHKTWLEYKYGWMPLLKDVEGAAEHYAQHTLGGRPPRFTVSSHEDFDLPRIEKVFQMGFFPVSSDNAGHNETVYAVGKGHIRTKIWVEVTNPRMAELSQLGLTNPAELAWELIPFSFVFDWFISVGDYLKGLSALHGMTVRKAMSSYYVTITGGSDIPARSRTYVSGGQTTTYTVTAMSWRSENRRYGRQHWNVDPLALYPPANKSAFNFNKLVTSLALLRARRII